MPSGPVSRGTEPVVYICAFEWGIVQSYTGQDAERDQARCAQAAPVTIGSGVLIASDIASWPKLPPSRSFQLETLQTLRTTRVVLMQIVCATSTLWQPRTLYIALGITALCWLIGVPVHGMAYVIQLQIMYSVHPGVNNDSSWRRQFLEIFRVSSFREVAWHHWPWHAVLWLVVMTISIPSMVAQRGKRIALRGGKPGDDQDAQLEALL